MEDRDHVKARVHEGRLFKLLTATSCALEDLRKDSIALLSSPTMPPATKIRQPTTRMTRTASSSKSKPLSSTSPDDLADKLATTLTISDSKGKRRAAAPTPEERKANAMRAVNLASKSLSAILESGWKASEAKPADRTTASTITKHAAAARKDLTLLRELSPGEVDLERAASSIVGKLISLEMVRPHITADRTASLILGEVQCRSWPSPRYARSVNPALPPLRLT